MLHANYYAGLLCLAIALAGCSGNYKISDTQYRPLGDPQAEKRRH
ncbi:type VI secretion protein [Pseudomonas typographi]|nr:type VI secretion protein [Pseudomonas typographi]MBD1553198.1 type VI secretion protein [Pseudomonas typographi]MBD1588078.1 type VI secretion protein [Pseudomonas typographi]